MTIKFMTAAIARLQKDEAGVTAIEYGLIASSVAVAIIAIVFVMGGNIDGLFQMASDAMKRISG